MTDLSWPPLMGNTLIFNLTAGGQGGTLFNEKNVEYPVKKIQVWGTVGTIHGIRITWRSDAPKQKTIGNVQAEGAEMVSLELADKERFTSFVIRTSKWVRRITAETDKGQMLEIGSKKEEEGEEGGEGESGGEQEEEEEDEFEMAVGSGFLAGFKGSADSNQILKLQALFIEPYVVKRTDYEPKGREEGSYFSAVRTDARVTRIDFWAGTWGKHFVVKRMGLTWENGESTTFGNTDDNQQHRSITFDVKNDERVAKLAFRQGWRLDQVWLKTTKGNEVLAGGFEGGIPPLLSVGNGVLLGFEGTVAPDLVKIAPVYALD
ncbi:hypothetical protein BO94DRAFT_605431 [Aspergillus sclerotioniger CBS 115572]|uniref:Jacalin-type lectin domain-containing protein n=1 Tax=Aspergillus sclerotioniger CBS 115572 TaxID=1450535 RepID=A0A317VTF8_9EURO|nr:hypothetical protein BO94DRAFT_605431 [Aspergillus sclerotioniger CBS 115572]PWY76128.1 hypothetical protein BO94DRAFT_605431 [Aspergillus sclerotioniger CBS 115572]